QCAQIADLTHWKNTRRKPSRHLGFGGCHGGPKLMQGLTPEADSDEQPVFYKRPRRLHDLPDRIVGPMQGHGMNDQIMAVGGKVQYRIVRDHAEMRELG